ncbi:IQ domain-containing protein F6-like [Vombatus ursinus]|uniref:IQ domain-containing protein F6-like n=1 Tax=Vombatus ursinus TaxID=29139 RepID=UPI000FFD7D15|nr:IQ domain-containing protein F6-like [Vombatus ursinus]
MLRSSLEQQCPDRTRPPDSDLPIRSLGQQGLTQATWGPEKGREGSGESERSRDKAAIKIQAWWRGTLLRRSLLHAALCAWIIQCWWRLAHTRLSDRRRRIVLQLYARREWAVVKLQAMVRMWRVRRRYLRAQAAARLIQMRWRSCLARGLLRGRYQITATGLVMDMKLWAVPSKPRPCILPCADSGAGLRVSKT